MHILVIDGGHVEAEFRAKFGPAHEYSFLSADNADYHEWDGESIVENPLRAIIDRADVAFCFNGAGYKLFAHQLLEPFSRISFHEIIDVPLIEIQSLAARSPIRHQIFGFCGLPTLVNRPLLEVSLHDEADRKQLAETCAALGTEYRVVADRVGMVTPRVICQIINEACFTVQEGTASMADVDLGMKLGTNYPRGPFAWANAIGVERVYAVLEALWQDTHDERYKICPLLKRQALRGEPFDLLSS